ncbi:hypothetical protein Ahy_A10g049034 isoform B [Arachis hypogaea]|uniref:Uncharacterized protein n=1 Tax=Arachis hypogaea TaxID=3818 RepID=A0A445B6E7_ARAHY|nr:hypothetical protein Ahy_A10g049034 isoform B [Arachis hypogaea]
MKAQRPVWTGPPPPPPNGVTGCRRPWLSEESFFVLSVFSKSDPLFDVFFITRRPSSIGFFLLLVVVLSPSSRRHYLEDYTEQKKPITWNTCTQTCPVLTVAS